MHAVAVAQHHVQLAQGAPALANRQVTRQQFDARCLAQGELPQAFVVMPQAPAAQLRQPVAQRVVVGIQRPQPAFKALRLVRPQAARKRVALGAGRGAEQRWRQQGPGQVAHGGAL
ncbi:hypothetical protein D3C80_1765750 [compost metagenome]